MIKAFKIFWKANPYFQITVGFLAAFITLVAVAGGHPIMYGIIGVTSVALIAGTWYNVKKIKERNEHEDRNIHDMEG
jgi:hypothetical protein